MSFGLSPSDVLKFAEISARVYIAFKDANDNSESKVESFVREFQNFARCLVELDQLMTDLGRPSLFPVEDFKKTLEKCEAALKPYEEHLLDRKMGLTKFVWTIKYIGKENELEGLRRQLTGHFQALSMSLQVLHIRRDIEAPKRERRLLLEPRNQVTSLGGHRSMSLGGQGSTHSATGGPSRSSPLGLPAPEEPDSLYKDWETLNCYLKSEHGRIGQDLELVQSSSMGGMPATAASDPAGTAARLYRLQCEVEDAIAFVDNRAKRVAAERRSHLAPSDAMTLQVREMPPAPRPRTYTIDTEIAASWDPFTSHADMSDSTATIRPGLSTPSPRTSPLASPQIEQEVFGSDIWVESPSLSSPLNLARSSVSTTRSSISMNSDGRLSPLSGLGITTANTTPEDALPHMTRSNQSSVSIAYIALGDGALQWSSLCRKVQVERKSSERVGGTERVISEDRECDLVWTRRVDGGMSVRAWYRSKKDGKVRVWTRQDFSALGPSIPLTTTIDGVIAVEFPRGTFGKLDKQWLDIKYTFATWETSAIFQTLLYTNNGEDAADLLFDRPIKTISSDRNRPECRGKNLRLWRRTERQLESSGPVGVDVLVLLFFTSSLEEKGHWVEEPHYAFEWLNESVYSKVSDKVTLAFSKDATKWKPDKLFSRRKSSHDSEAPTSPVTARRDSMEIPGIARSPTGGSAASIKSSRSSFGRSKKSRAGHINESHYTKLDIHFQNNDDRKSFLDVWKKYVKPLGTMK